jgi:hypothetical protein
MLSQKKNVVIRSEAKDLNGNPTSTSAASTSFLYCKLKTANL